MTADELAQPFPKELLESTQRGGRTFTYIPASEVIVRLNRVLGPDNWSTDAEAHRDEEWIIAKVRLTAHFATGATTATQYGGQEIKRYSKGDRVGQIMDLSSDYKGAVSDALKKAAQQLGVGLYLARTDAAKRLVPQRTAAVDHGGSDTGGAGGIESVPSQGDTRQQPPATIGEAKRRLETAGLNATAEPA